MELPPARSCDYCSHIMAKGQLPSASVPHILIANSLAKCAVLSSVFAHLTLICDWGPLTTWNKKDNTPEARYSGLYPGFLLKMGLIPTDHRKMNSI